ncbi:hypothetical protein MesoLj131c_49420 [Mesorhizobium sp. 131-3-5]|nr:hypothetical protein MesoLj131c_49420 [Mesorhizobium sp. 131-3-5]
MPTDPEASQSAAIVAAEPYGRVIVRAALWLAFLAPFFYLTYGLANWLASRRDDVGSIVFSWEHSIPFRRLDHRALLVDQPVLRPVAAA